MEIEPPSLNVPLEREEHWGLLLVVVCAGITAVAALFNPAFAAVFAASSIVGLPVVFLMFFPSPISSRFTAWGDTGRVAFSVVLFGYIALAKVVLVPIVISVIEHVFW